MQQAYRLLFPPVCLACNAEMDTHALSLCPECKESLQPIASEYCLKCGVPLSAKPCPVCSESTFKFSFARAGWCFQGPAQELVHSLKYDHLLSPVKFFASGLMEIPSLVRFSHGYDLIMAVPLHRVKKRDRGFNQSELIARELAKRLNIPYLEPVIRRVNTLSQTNLGREARKNNLHNAFQLRKKADVTGKKIILVDDVFTTGTTVNEISALLKEHDADRIAVLTATRAV
jgi:competence protein ComFC